MTTELTKILSIDTIFGRQEDFSDVDKMPFKLVFAQVSEGISMPFAYDLKLYRSHTLPDVDIATLINTRVAIGVRFKDKLIKRVGVIANMNKSGVSDEQHKFKNSFNVYSAHVVPAFKMLDNETTFRTFEDQKFSDIFKEVIKDFPGIPSSGYVNFGQLSADEDEKFDYCVQFGESSFNFLSRLMQQLGIWYMFEHRDVQDANANETMVLGKSLVMAQQCDSDSMKIDKFEAEEGQIAQFSRAFVPAAHHVWVADFNESDPTQPPKEPDDGGDRDVMAHYDLQPGEPKGTSRFMIEQFPNNGSAETLMRSQEYGVFLAQGQSKNLTFQAGRTFRIIADDTDTGNKGKLFLLTALNFTVQDFSADTGTGFDLLNILGDATWRPLLSAPKADQKVFNVLGSISSSGLANYLQNEGPYAVAVAGGLKKSDGSAGGGNMPYFLNFAAGGPIAAAGGVLAQVLMASLDKVIFNPHDNPYANTFVAVPFDGVGWRMPLPSANSPTVHGVHLAVVVGTKGVDTSQRGTINTNDKGQVRVRFGWQRKVGQATGAPLDPLTTDSRAAWVRVAENWAGRTYGTQFLPRVGDEVVVSFIDGDPGRPIVTGRVYNDYATQPFDPQKTTQSGIRTQTTPPGSSPGFHLLRFDDKPGAEQLLLRAQQRMDMAVLGSSYVGIGGHSHETIGWVDPLHKTTGGSYFGKVCEDYHLHIGDPAGPLNGGFRYETVEKDYHLHVKQQTHFNLEGNLSASVGGKTTISADSIVLKAVKSITMTVGNSTIVIQSDGIYNEAAIHYEQCGAQGLPPAEAELHEPTSPTGPDSGKPKQADDDDDE